MAHLLQDLLPEIPRQDQNIVGSNGIDRLNRSNWNMYARRESPVLVRIAINGEVEEVDAHAAIVEECVAFARRAVAANSLASFFDVDETRQQPTFGPLNPRGKGS